MKKIIISALSENRVIGTPTGMPWHIPEEYQQYLDFIEGQTVVMGRTTYEIFGKDLTSKHTIIISRSMRPTRDYEVCPSVSQALAQAEAFGKDIYIAGGESVYRQTLNQADYLYLSWIKGNYEGTAFFPEIPLKYWASEYTQSHEAFTFMRYRRTCKHFPVVAKEVVS